MSISHIPFYNSLNCVPSSYLNLSATATLRRIWEIGTSLVWRLKIVQKTKKGTYQLESNPPFFTAANFNVKVNSTAGC